MSNEKKCAVCGQSADRHFTDFVDGVPVVGSYNEQGNAQRCSGLSRPAEAFGLIELASLMRDYYKELIRQNVPDDLARRAAGDWHAAALAAAREHIVMKMTKDVARGRA